MAELSSFASATNRTADQQKALLEAVAQAGTAGAKAYQTAQDQTGQLKQQAVGAALNAAGTSPLAQVPGGSNALTAPVEGNFAMRQADLAQGQATFGQDIARQQASGNQFFGQMQAAIPIVESRTRQAVERILADQQSEREVRQNQLEMSRNSLAQSRMGAEGKPQSISESIALAREEREKLCFENPSDPRCTGTGKASSPADAQRIGQESGKRALQQVLASEPARVSSMIAAAFDSDNPIAYLQSQLGTTLETASEADQGGRGATHRKGALNYEYLMSRVNQILQAEQAAYDQAIGRAGSTGAGGASGSGGD